MNKFISVIRDFRLLTFLIATVLLSGCISNTSKPASFYVINASESLQSLLDENRKGPAIKISAVDIPPYLDRKQIVTRQTDNQLHFSEQHRWAGRFRKNLSRVMARNLSQLLGNADVAVSPSSLPIKASYQVAIEISRFERDVSGYVVLSASWRIVRDKDMSLVISGSETFKSSMTSEIQDYRATVSAMAETYSRLSVMIANNLVADAGQ